MGMVNPMSYPKGGQVPRWDGCHTDQMFEQWISEDMRRILNDAVNASAPGLSASTSRTPELSVKKYGAIIPFSDDAAMEYGLIPDTRPPVHYSRRLRFRWWRQAKVDGMRMRVGSWVAGVDLAERDDY